MTGDPLGIVELVDVCHSMQRRNAEMFARLGTIVTRGEAGANGRLLAEACHRHAWHAELWAARRPTIPVAPTVATTGIDPGVDEVGDDDGGDGDLIGAYRAEVTALRTMVSELASRVDRDLDPGTARVIDLVEADLGSLDDRLAAAPVSGSSRNS